VMQLVSLYSEPGEAVFDPTAGSGTTGVAAIRQGRRFIGIETLAETYAVCRDRLAAETRGLDLHSVRSGQMSILDYTRSAR
jgi:site-specific DNA-methyltransferase (adenine-specific)